MLSTEFAAEGSTEVSSKALPPLLRFFELWTLLLAALSLFFHLFMWRVMHAHGHLVFPFSLNSHDRFYDFTIFTDKFRLFHSAEFFQVGFPINYPAPVAVLFEIFFRFLKPHEVFAFVSFCVLSFVVPFAFFARALVRRGVGEWQAASFAGILCFLSWPVLLIVDGANAEVFVWLALLGAFWAYATGRKWTAAILFGVAGSLKLFPVIFLALYLSRWEWKRFAAGVLSFLVVSVVSLKILGPTVGTAYRGIAYGLANFKTNYMAQWHTSENGVDHSIFATIKGLLVIGLHHKTDDFSGWLRVYLLATALGGTLLYFLWIRKLPLLNQILALSVISIYFTAFSGDGTLIHLYYPLAMLFLLALQAYRDHVQVPGLGFCLGCMVACTAVSSFLVVRFHAGSARIIGPIHGVFLGALLIASLLYPLGPSLHETNSETVLSQPVTTWVAGRRPGR